MDELVMVVAYVRRTRRALVGVALRQIDVSGWTESDVLGHGQAAAGHGVEHVRIEIVVPAERADLVSQTIAGTVRAGAEGDGLIVVMPVSHVLHIANTSP